ncbi:anti-sigma B factor antagonist [Azotobacter beijerinckii]|uniref:Anti-sigma factor antagonist n=1 Tax=Azotobacter beijerinckii TaxID=170623 RepID=A0A1H8ZYC7_9GAMM|nr:STAS domain-containing protein [Azotobacter beijerinckii]SEP69257.1 anti-sigma B factor antagonist [Azotobacter beijerinckii]
MIKTDLHEDGILILTLTENRLDAANTPQFRELVIEQLKNGLSRIVLNMHTVQFVDSSGLGGLVSILKRIGPMGDLVLVGLAPNVLKTFTLTRMDRVFSIAPDVDAALKQLQD